MLFFTGKRRNRSCPGGTTVACEFRWIANGGSRDTSSYERQLRRVCAAALTSCSSPWKANAQSRQAVPRPVPSRAVGTRRRVYRGPAVLPLLLWPIRIGMVSAYTGFYRGYYPIRSIFQWDSRVAGIALRLWLPVLPLRVPLRHQRSLRLQVTPREAEVFVDGYYRRHGGRLRRHLPAAARRTGRPRSRSVPAGAPQLPTEGVSAAWQDVQRAPRDGAAWPWRGGARATGRRQRPTKSARSIATPAANRDRPIRDAEPNPRSGTGVTRSEFGSLALRVQPGDASVTIDGEAWENSGDNERLIVQLGSGVHNVQIRKGWISDVHDRRHHSAR